MSQFKASQVMLVYSAELTPAADFLNLSTQILLIYSADGSLRHQRQHRVARHVLELIQTRRRRHE